MVLGRIYNGWGWRYLISRGDWAFNIGRISNAYPSREGHGDEMSYAGMLFKKIAKLRHQYDEIDESLAVAMREDYYQNYNTSHQAWDSLRFDYKISWIVRAQKMRKKLTNIGLEINKRMMTETNTVAK